jgi:ribosomal protein L7Ae-like RNA K-turn-binding protein
MQPTKLAGMLGLARRAGVLLIGRNACKRAAVQGRVALLILARDAGGSAARDAGADAAQHTLQCDADKVELGRWVGRSSVAVVAVTDANLAAGILAGADSVANAADATRAERRRRR